MLGQTSRVAVHLAGIRRIRSQLADTEVDIAYGTWTQTEQIASEPVDFLETLTCDIYVDSL